MYPFGTRQSQQAAGMIMKIAAIPVIWGTMLAMMMRWITASEATDRYRRRHGTDSPGDIRDEPASHKEPG